MTKRKAKEAPFKRVQDDPRMTHKLKVGDIISYEPRPEDDQAQCMWGCVGVVRELGDVDFYDQPTLFVRWIHHLPPGVDDQWVNMRITEGNCRKIGEVGEVPDGEAEAR